MSIYYLPKSKFTCISDVQTNLTAIQFSGLLKELKRLLICNGSIGRDTDGNRTIMLSGNRKEFIDENLQNLIYRLFQIVLNPVDIA